MSISSFDSLPHAVIEYISCYGQYLDTSRLGTMRLEGDQPSIYESWFDKYLDTAVGLGLSAGTTVAAEGQARPSVGMNQRT